MGQRYQSEYSSDDSEIVDDQQVEKTAGIDSSVQTAIEDFVDEATEDAPEPDQGPESSSSQTSASDFTTPDDVDGPTTFDNYSIPLSRAPSSDSLSGPDCYTNDTFKDAQSARNTMPPPSPSSGSQSNTTGPDRSGVSDRKNERVLVPGGEDSESTIDSAGGQPNSALEVGMDGLSNEERMRRQEAELENPTGDKLLSADASYEDRTEAPSQDTDIHIAERTIGDILDDDVTRRLNEPNHVNSARDRMDIAGETVPRPPGSTLVQQEKIEGRKTQAQHRQKRILDEIDRWGPDKAAKRREVRSQKHRDTMEPTDRGPLRPQQRREFLMTPSPLITESLRDAYPDGGDSFDETVEYVTDRTDCTSEEARATVSKTLVFSGEFKSVSAAFIDYQTDTNPGIVADVDTTSIDQMTNDLREARNAAIATLDRNNNMGGIKPEAALWEAKIGRYGETTGTVVGRVKHVESDPWGDGLEKVLYIEPDTAPQSMPDIKVGVYESHNVKEDDSPGPHITDDIKRPFDPVEGDRVEIDGRIQRYEGFDDDRFDVDAQPAVNLTKGCYYRTLQPSDQRSSSSSTTKWTYRG